jgi:phosphatidylglycerol:prolipoprotein diacylglycerol transferase
VSGLFLIAYGSFRFVAEFFREPDVHIGFIGGEWLTMGMLLSLPMLAAGIAIMFFAYRNQGK